MRFKDDIVSDRSPPGRRSVRHAVLIASGVIAALCALIVVAVLLLGAQGISSSPPKELLIGDVHGLVIAFVATAVGAPAVATFLLSVSRRRWWPLLSIPAALVAAVVVVLSLWLLPLARVHVTAISAGGCVTGYVAVESAGGGGSFVGVRDGVFAVHIQEILVDDFGTPFSRGDYSASVESEQVLVDFVGGAGFALPLLPESEGGNCG